MKILWVINKGRLWNSLPKLAGELFSKVLPSPALKELKNLSASTDDQIPYIFERYSNYTISICQSFDEWLAYQEERFDIACIDVNLAESGIKPNSYLGHFRKVSSKKEHDTKLGFYIYNALLRDGLPINHVILFVDSKRGFHEICSFSCTQLYIKQVGLIVECMADTVSIHFTPIVIMCLIEIRFV